MAGKFELYKDAKGKYRFRLKASNGQIIAVGEAYESKAAAKNGIASVQKNAAVRLWLIWRSRQRRERTRAGPVHVCSADLACSGSASS